MNPSGSPKVDNILIPFKDTEVAIPVSKGVKKLLLQTRNGSDIKISFEKGQSDTNYFTLRSFNTYFEDLITGPFTFYIQAITDNTVIELVTWTHYY